MSLDKKPCDMGEICLNCQPRGINGECPDAKPAHAGPVIKVLVRGSNAPLHVTGWYGDTVFVDLPEATPAAPAPLSKERLRELMIKSGFTPYSETKLEAFAREVEQAHGIGIAAGKERTDA